MGKSVGGSFVTVLQALVIAAGTLVLGVLVFGFATRRIPWRAAGCCCPVDPERDARMRPYLDDAWSRR